MKTHTHTLCYTLSLVSPQCAVVVTWFTVTVPVGILEDQPLLSIIYSSGTRGHAVWTISKVCTCDTLICTLTKNRGKREKQIEKLQWGSLSCNKPRHKRRNNLFVVYMDGYNLLCNGQGMAEGQYQIWPFMEEHSSFELEHVSHQRL